MPRAPRQPKEPKAPKPPKPPKPPKEKKPPKPLAARYSIAEWYGRDMLALTPEQRQEFGQLAAKQFETKKLVDPPPCPFLATLLPNALCNKRGGVCSIRRYDPGPDKTGVPVAGDKPVTTCPNRFLQDVGEGQSLFNWIGDKMIDTPNPIIIKETPFLRKVSDRVRPPKAAEDPEVAQDLDEEEEEEKKAGRIDWIVVKPDTMDAGELEWAAIETQALYFSGRKMPTEFEAYGVAPSGVLFPINGRRPDYRSSGPKRLTPQLDVKVPVLRSWGKKVAVVIDRYFFDNMNRLEEAYSRARDERARRDNAEIVWFVLEYDDQMRMRPSQVVYSTLESSRKALNATEPLSKVDFTNNLKGVIKDKRRANKVFKASLPEAPE